MVSTVFLSRLMRRTSVIFNSPEIIKETVEMTLEFLCFLGEINIGTKLLNYRFQKRRVFLIG